MKLNKKTLAVLGATVATIGMMGSANAERAFGDIYTECGIGAGIFPKHEVMAAISNVTWDLGTTAITSNYSSEDSCKGKEVASAAFIHGTYSALEQDIAKGEGQHLSALMDIMNCDASARANVVHAVRADFSNAVSADTYSTATSAEKSEQLYNIVNANKAACGA